MEHGEISTKSAESISATGGGRTPAEIQHDRHTIEPMRPN